MKSKHWSTLGANKFRYSLDPAMLLPDGLTVEGKTQGIKRGTSETALIHFDKDYVVAAFSRLFAQLDIQDYETIRNLVETAHSKAFED